MQLLLRTCTDGRVVLRVGGGVVGYFTREVLSRMLDHLD